MRDPREFVFHTDFTVDASREQVREVLVDLEHYGDWWPQVRAVVSVDDDHAHVLCRSALPFDLPLDLSARERSQDRLEVGIDGPIRGFARFHLDEVAPRRTGIRFQQEVRAQAWGMVLASYALKPVLGWNHRHMMRGCQEGLRRRLG